MQRHGQHKRPQTQAAHNCLYYLRSAASPAWSFAPVRRESERQSVEVKGNFCANNSEALRELVLAGQGIALLPDFTAQSEVDAGRLVPLQIGRASCRERVCQYV